jgi:hypothetical protein
LNDGTILTISKDRVRPSPYPNSWNLSEIFTYAIVYGIYLAASTIVFFALIVQTTFFRDYFGVEQFEYNSHSTNYPGWNHPMLNSIIYLQVSTISQALIFITRSQSFFFLERPSMLLVGAFFLAQFIATVIAGWANWTFTHIHGCGWTWIGIVWLWNLIWFFPLDLVKVHCLIRIRFVSYMISVRGCSFQLTLRKYFDSKQKQTIEESLATEPSTDDQLVRRKTTMNVTTPYSISGPPSRRLTRLSNDSRHAKRDTLTEATARYYGEFTRHLSTASRHRNTFQKRASRSSTILVDSDELKRFSLVQVS